MFRSSFISILLLWTTVYNSNAEEQIKCQFTDTSFGYACEIDGLQIDDLNSTFNIVGNHSGNRTDEDVKYLQIDNNSFISHIPMEFFETFPNLKAVKVEHGRLRQLNIFRNCGNLRDLYIKAMQLEVFPENALQECKNLRNDNNLLNFNISGPESITYLDLYINKLKYVGDLSQLRNLVWLSVVRNEIQELFGQEFTGLTKLRELHLYKNKIKKIHPSTFQGLNELGWIHLFENDISEISDGTFSSLPALQVLRIDHNEIQRLRSNLFDGSPEIRDFLVWDNFIEVIEEGVFDRLTKLEDLQLRGNKCIDKDFKISPPGNISSILPDLQNCKPTEIDCSFDIQASGFNCQVGNVTHHNVKSIHINS